jgi:hypothetical protein
MSIEEAIMGGIVFKGKKDKPKEEEKVKTKAKKATYIRGQHGSGAAKMKADIRKKRANRHKNRLGMRILSRIYPLAERTD